MALTEQPTVVLDHGSDKIKAGFADCGAPAVIIRSVVGRPKAEAAESFASSVCFGDEAVSRKDKLKLRFPIEWCTTVNWEETRMLWQHVFENKLDADMSKHPLLVSEPPTNPKLNREKTAELAFETFGVPAFGMASAASQAMLAAGHLTGLVVDLGEGPVRVMPVCEGYFLPSSYFRCQVDGAHVTQALKNFICEQYSSAQELSWETVKDIKEKFAYVAQAFENKLKTSEGFLKEADTLFPAQQEKLNRLPSGKNFAHSSKNFENEMNTSENTPEATPTHFSVHREKEYLLPSGKSITLGKELFQCAEVLFKPALLGIEMMGVAQHICYTISKSAKEIQQGLAGNIVLTGGGGKLPGMADRILHDVKQHLSEKGYSHLNVNVVSPPNPETMVWRGGALMASSPAVRQIMMTKEEYGDCGPSLIHQKCL